MTNNSAIANVRLLRDDFRGRRFHNVGMAKRPRKPRIEQYEAFKEASGWYLAAWRDFRGLTLEELADEAQTSKGVVSDMETGALKSSGDRAQRFNRDWIDRFSKALGTSGGFLIDVNPYAVDPAVFDLGRRYGELSAADRTAVEQLVSHLESRKVG